jgi:phosphatidylinositol glycan class T
MKPVMGLFFFFFFFFFLLTSFDDLVVCAKEEDFSEELLLRPLPDGKVLAHFQFTHRLHPPVGNTSKKSNKNNERHHHRLFPKSIYQLVSSSSQPLL